MKRVRSSSRRAAQSTIPVMVDDYVRRGILWVGIYLAVVLAPLFVLLIGPTPAGSGFWWDLSAAFGFAAAAMMAVMFVLTARFKKVSAPFGIDLVYCFHR